MKTIKGEKQVLTRMRGIQYELANPIGPADREAMYIEFKNLKKVAKSYERARR